MPTPSSRLLAGVAWSLVLTQVPTPAPVALPPGLDWDLLLKHGAPLVGVVVIIVVGALALRWVLNSPVAEALAERIRRRSRSDATGDEGQRVAALEDQVAQLTAHVAELGERLDFTERVLAERRERKLGAGQ
ncbi:MAG TPA: hypothetical protein VH116_13190 [Gemmatimonadales bacterium]|nr:hypothetical protein [Gemmatimonadales bacterium]